MSNPILTVFDGQGNAIPIPAFGGSGGGGSSETWADDLLASGTLIANNAVLYDTGITLAKLREYKTFVYLLKGVDNKGLGNLYLRIASNESDAAGTKNIALERGNDGGRIVVYEWADADKNVLRPRSGYNGNPSMVILGSFARANDSTQVLYGTGQYNIMSYIDLSARADADRLYFSCTNTPTIDYNFEIRGLTK